MKRSTFLALACLSRSADALLRAPAVRICPGVPGGHPQGPGLGRQAAAKRRPLGGQRRPVPRHHDRPGRHGRCSWKAAPSARASTPTTSAGPSTGSWPAAQPNGLLGNPNNPGEAGRYMYGHGFGLLFLACVYGEEEDGDRRKKLEEILTAGRRVHRQGPDEPRRLGLRLGEGRQQLRRRLGHRSPRCRPCGPPATPASSCPRRSSTRPSKYLKDSTNAQGGVIYSLAHGGGGRRRPAGPDRGGHRLRLQRRRVQLASWSRSGSSSASTTIPASAGGRIGHDEYTHYYSPRPCTSSATTARTSCSPNGQGRPADLEQVPQGDVRQPRRSRRTADGSWSGGYDRPGLRHRRLPDHPATGQWRRCRFTSGNVATACRGSAPRDAESS